MTSAPLNSTDSSIVNALRKELEDSYDDDAESIITNERYEYIAKLMKQTYVKKHSGMSVSDRIDRFVTNRWLALPIFAVVMYLVYYVSVTTVGTYVTGWTNDVLFGDIIPPAVTSFLEGIWNCRLAGFSACRWYHCRYRGSSRLCSADAGALPVSGDSGRLRLYGTYRLYHGPYFPQIRIIR